MTLRAFLDDAYGQSFEATLAGVEADGVVLDRTLFYATSGGQPGDVGTLRVGGKTFSVTETRKHKEKPDMIVHMLAGDDWRGMAAGAAVTGALDWDRRYRHMRMHTALHLICALIEGYATGNQINADKARIDFDVDRGLLDKDELTQKLRAFVAADHPVTYSTISEDELDANPGLVRTLSVKPPRGSGIIRMVTIGDILAPVDRQPCGGTHVKSTREIGDIVVTKIENKGKQNKRISLAFASDLAQQEQAA